MSPVKKGTLLNLSTSSSRIVASPSAAIPITWGIRDLSCLTRYRDRSEPGNGSLAHSRARIKRSILAADKPVQGG